MDSPIVTQNQSAGPVMPGKWVPNAANFCAESHDWNLGFCPASSQLYRAADG
jgi:hypothetical protein